MAHFYGAPLADIQRIRRLYPHLTMGMSNSQVAYFVYDDHGLLPDNGGRLKSMTYTYNNFTDFIEAVQAAEKLHMGYSVTKGLRSGTSAKGNTYTHMQWILTLTEKPKMLDSTTSSL